jgi:hypothetical protein
MSEGEVQDRPLAAAHRETAKMLLCSLSIDVGTGVDERPNLARVAFLNCFEELLVQLMLFAAHVLNLVAWSPNAQISGVAKVARLLRQQKA